MCGRCMPFYITGNDVLKGQQPNGVSVQVFQKQSHTELEYQKSHTVLRYLVTVLTQRRCCEQNDRKKSAFTKDTCKVFT